MPPIVPLIGGGKVQSTLKFDLAPYEQDDFITVIIKFITPTSPCGAPLGMTKFALPRAKLQKSHTPTNNTNNRAAETQV
jgi:hypothetical protein